MKTDVAIIGAGPAGSTLATMLSRRGVGVALIDRDVFPRDKLCGEFLSYDALPILDRLGITAALDAHGAPEIRRCRIVSRSKMYGFELPHAARGVSRMLFDRLLFDAAIQSGSADWSGWTATRVTANDVEATSDDRRVTIDARVVVGAWGRWGRFDAQLGRRFVRDRSHRNFGFKRHYRSDRASAGEIDLYSFRRGYLGASPIEGGLTNICGLVHADRLSGLKGRWDAFVQTIQAEEEPLAALYGAHEPAQEGYLSSEPVIFRARSPVENGVLMVGDASGVIDPLTGNGMAMAIQSALVAAPAILQLLQFSDRVRSEAAYRGAHHAFFTPRIRWSRRVATLLSHPSLLDAALRAVRSRRAGEFLLGRTRARMADVERMVDAW